MPPWDPGPFNSSLQKLATWSMRIPQKEVVFILLSIKETQIPIYLILKHSDVGTHMRTHIQIHRATCCSPPPQPEHLHLNGPWLCLWGIYRMDGGADKGSCLHPCRITVCDFQVSSLKISKLSKVTTWVHFHKTMSEPLRDGRRLFPRRLFLIPREAKHSMSGHTGWMMRAGESERRSFGTSFSMGSTSPMEDWYRITFSFSSPNSRPRPIPSEDQEIEVTFLFSLRPKLIESKIVWISPIMSTPISHSKFRLYEFILHSYLGFESSEKSLSRITK